MKVLKAIGGFFCKIGRWIRDTAWVQPLLIVGGIFAIIFSIPYIVSAVESGFEEGNESAEYFENYKKSVNGSKDMNSEADKLLKYVMDREAGTSTPEQKAAYGDQFFLTFVNSSCPNCESIYPGFQALETNFNQNDSFRTVEGVSKEFKLYTIFIDEKTDDELPEGTQGNAFSAFISYNYSDLFEQSNTMVAGRPYYVNNKGDESTEGYGKQLQDLSDLENFPVPTTFMFDFNFKDPQYTSLKYGITDILFNFNGKNGSDDFAMAQTLLDCWNHKGVFADFNK